MEGRVEDRNKRKLGLVWEEVLPERNDAVPAELIVKKAGPPTPAPISNDSGSGEELARSIPDHELGPKIARMKETYGKLRHNLPDKGERILATVTLLEKERKKRRIARAETDVKGCRKSTRSMYSVRRWKKMYGILLLPSPFYSLFCIQCNCDRRKMKCDGDISQRGRRKDQSSLRKWPFHRGDKSFTSNGVKKDRASFNYLSHQTGENLSSCLLKKKDAFEVLPLNNSRRRKGKTLVLLDEDESQVEEASKEAEESLHVETTEEADELAECMKDANGQFSNNCNSFSMKDAKIFYPSRVDPEAVEICYSDINHLAPAAYLTSPIMNFYIRYLQLQASPTNRATQNCHFFNTYFYNKLKEAVSHKGDDKYSLFIKFRRWWKGISIFQKSYVLIPIHEDVHWSLVIICIPDKEDESGPIILHLDSLKLHSSQSIFSNIRSFLKEEWDYLEQEVSPSDLPISDRIWQHLPRRIVEKIIPVPQQKNDYDCGLFVLFFMERFIEEAPERLKKKDLVMFGKRWFRPEDASGLRVKVRNLLVEQFQLASAECCISKSSSSPSGATP